MPLDPRLENYLATLDRILRPVPASERADIVMEIKSHVLSALERDPQASTESILQALGEPETVANRYLLERGLKPAKPPISPVVKWIMLGVLGCIALAIAGTVALLFAFSPVLKVSEEEGKVVLLGGLIDIDEGKGSVKIGDAEISTHKNKRVEGRITVQKGGKVAGLLTNGRLSFETTEEPELQWECRIDEKDGSPEIALREETQTLDLTKLKGAHCEVKVPVGSPLFTEVQNGRVKFEKPRFDIDAKLTNGRIEIEREEGVEYAYELTVKNGRAPAAPSSANPAYRIHAEVGNGHISFE